MKKELGRGQNELGFWGIGRSFIGNASMSGFNKAYPNGCHTERRPSCGAVVECANWVTRIGTAPDEWEPAS